MSRRLAPILACVAPLVSFAPQALASGAPQAKLEKETDTDDISPRGFTLELLPAASLCLPRADIKCEREGFGSTGVAGGLGVFLGYRALRSLAVGVGYDVGLLRPNYQDLPDGRDYQPIAHTHGVFAILRPILPHKAWDISADLGLGWSWLNFGLDGGGTRMYSQGFAMRLAPGFDYWVSKRMYLGVRADFILNFHGKRCIEGAAAGNACEKPALRANSHQLPIHQVLPGFHLGWVFGSD